MRPEATSARYFAVAVALNVGGAIGLAVAALRPDLVAWIPLHPFAIIMFSIGALGWGLDRLVRVWRPVEPRNYFRGPLGHVRLVGLTGYCGLVVADLAYLVARRAAPTAMTILLVAMAAAIELTRRKTRRADITKGR